MAKLDARDGTSRFERHAQARRAGWHGCVPRFAPGDLEEAWPLDADIVPADQDTVGPALAWDDMPPASRAGHAAYQRLEAATDPYLKEVHLAA